MTVAKVEYGNYTTLIGTDPEVVGALQSNGVIDNNVIAIYHNGTNTTAVYSQS